MAFWESESDQEQGKHFPDVLPLGECVRHEEQLTPPSIPLILFRSFPRYHLDNESSSANAACWLRWSKSSRPAWRPPVIDI
jgi:hypothetical protein